MGRTQRAERAIRRDQAEHQSAARRRPRGHRLLLPAARHSRHRHVGRRHVHARRSRRTRRELPRRKPGALPRSRAQAAGDRHRDHDVPAGRAAGVHRRRSRQGPQARRRSFAGQPDDADVHGRLLRELLQPLRPAVAGLRAGRRRLPHEGGERRPLSRAELEQRDGAAQHA